MLYVEVMNYQDGKCATCHVTSTCVFIICYAPQKYKFSSSIRTKNHEAVSKSLYF
jgi:hypothetical protein